MKKKNFTTLVFIVFFIVYGSFCSWVENRELQKYEARKKALAEIHFISRKVWDPGIREMEISRVMKEGNLTREEVREYLSLYMINIE